jgi:hypothetical protein
MTAWFSSGSKWLQHSDTLSSNSLDIIFANPVIYESQLSHSNLFDIYVVNIWLLNTKGIVSRKRFSFPKLRSLPVFLVRDFLAPWTNQLCTMDSVILIRRWSLSATIQVLMLGWLMWFRNSPYTILLTPLYLFFPKMYQIQSKGRSKPSRKKSIPMGYVYCIFSFGSFPNSSIQDAFDTISVTSTKSSNT